MTATTKWSWRGLVAGLALGLCAAAAPAQGGASLLDRLPRVPTGGYAKALAAAQARGPAGRADTLWIELFYGDAAAQARAEAELRTPTVAGSDGAEIAFAQFVAAYVQGQDRQMLEAAVRLTQAAPNDVATELAVRTLSGQLENQGRTLLDAVPSLERALRQPLADPTTSYMLGRSLLAAVHAPGLALTAPQAMALAGRLPHWQEWGPFGAWQNLGFDRTFPPEQAMAAQYEDGGQARRPQPFDNAEGGGVVFPLDWGTHGVDFAVTYVRAAAPARVLLRLYTQASVAVAINGATVLRNDRRASYQVATASAAVDLAAGWNRVVVKLAGDSSRTFDLMLRPAPGVNLEDAAVLPAGASLAAAPTPQPAPFSLEQWSAARLSQSSDDSLALWVDGIRLVQDENAEQARVELEKASRLTPQSAAVWLDLAQAYGQLSDASQSWVAAQVEHAAQQALKASPRALRAYDRLGHVYQSQGKPTQAAEQFAHCANRGFAACDWSSFGLAAEQRWIPEAEAALQPALAESGSDWPGIASGMEFYSSVGDAAQLAQWERVLAADPRAAGTLAGFDLRHGDAAKAADLFRTAIGFDPSSPVLRQQYLDALLVSGGAAAAQPAARQAVTDFPQDWRIASAADEITLRQDPRAGIAALRATDFRRNVLRHEADFLAGNKFWAPWYHSAAEILKDAPGKDAYPNASSILVFDQMVNRINPDSTQDQYIHQIYRVLNAVGISEFGDVTTILPGSDLITVRTIKQDGRMLLPEHIANLSSISMPGLEAGDYIEVEFVQHVAASPVVPGTTDNTSFFVFNSSKQPFHYSDYIVLTPPRYPLMVDQERFPGQPTVQSQPGGWTSREWLVQKTRILVTEPHMPEEYNLVPKVWVASQQSWDQIGRYLADNMFAVRKATPEMQAEAATLVAGKTTAIARADAIFQWVVDNIQPGEGTMLAPARQFFTDRSGNRIATFLGLLSAAKVPYQLVVAKASTDDSSTLIPSLFQYQYPLVHVAGAAEANSPAGWYDLNNDFAQLQYVVPAMRGGQALVAAASGPADFTTVPSFSSPLDGVVVRITGSVADSGDAKVHLEIEFRGPNGEQVRSALANQPDSSLPQIYQQMMLANYPSGIASSGQLINRDAKDKPLIIAVDGTVPDLVHSDAAAAGSSWNVQRLAAPVGVLARYAPLPFRTEPLVIAGDNFEQTQVTLTLPARFGAVVLPAAAQLENPFGRFSSDFTQSTANGAATIQFDRIFYLRANLIPPKDYSGFRSFAEAVDQQDRLQLTGAVK